MSPCLSGHASGCTSLFAKPMQAQGKVFFLCNHPCCHYQKFQYEGCNKDFASQGRLLPSHLQRTCSPLKRSPAEPLCSQLYTDSNSRIPLPTIFAPKCLLIFWHLHTAHSPTALIPACDCNC